jgi:acyl-CoA synthetase (AMP-forming)/AMP-acid ligase II
VFIDPAGARKDLTYAQLDLRANRLANSLLAAGATKGERVAVLSHNSDDHVVAWYAALRLGTPLTGTKLTFPAFGDREVFREGWLRTGA